MIGQSSPVSDVARFAQRIEDMARRIAELERPHDVGVTVYQPTLSVIVTGTGNAGNSAQYTVAGRLNISGIIRFGTTGQTFPGGGTEGFSLPAGFAARLPSNLSPMPVGTVAYYDFTAPTAGAVGLLVAVNGDTSLTFVTSTLGSLGSTTPFAWAASDEIRYTASVPFVRV